MFDCLWMKAENVHMCLCAYLFCRHNVQYITHQHLLRHVVQEAASVRRNLLAWNHCTWYFLRPWPSITRSQHQHPSLIRSIPCIPFLYSHLPISLHWTSTHQPTSPHPALCCGSLSPSNSWAQLAADWNFCLALTGCCSWVTLGRDQPLWTHSHFALGSLHFVITFEAEDRYGRASAGHVCSDEAHTCIWIWWK